MTESRDWPAVTVHPSQHPARLAEQLIRALRSRRLPAKFHYLTPQQARRWLDVHAAYAPSGGSATATTDAYRRLFEDLAHLLAERPVQIVSLGCGGGGKDALLAEALRKAGCPLRYLAVDAGQALVLIAADAVAGAAPTCAIRRLVADIDKMGAWREFIARGGKHNELQIFCAFGITPNADADRLIARLADQSVAGDHLLISANLFDPDDAEYGLQAILPQYDNPETRRWLATFFADLDWPVAPEQFAFELHEQESPAQISAALTLPHALDLSIDAMQLHMSAGEHLDVFFSNRFRPADLTALLDRHGFGHSLYTETAPSTEAVWRAEKV